MFLRYIKVWFGNWDLWQETLQIIFSTKSLLKTPLKRVIQFCYVSMSETWQGCLICIYPYAPLRLPDDPHQQGWWMSRKRDGMPGVFLKRFLSVQPNWNWMFSAPCKQEPLRPEHALFKIQMGTQTWINDEAEQFFKCLGDLGKWWNRPTHPLCPSANPPSAFLEVKGCGLG